MDETEFKKWTTYRGHRVRVTLQREPELVQHSGQLLMLADSGEVDLRDEMGFVLYCWPALEIELL